MSSIPTTIEEVYHRKAEAVPFLRTGQPPSNGAEVIRKLLNFFTAMMAMHLVEDNGQWSIPASGPPEDGSSGDPRMQLRMMLAKESQDSDSEDVGMISPSSPSIRRHQVRPRRVHRVRSLL